MEDNPYYTMIKSIKKMQGEPGAVFRFGTIKTAAPLVVAVGDNLCDDEILGVISGYEPKKGDSVLLACVDGDDGYIVLGKVVDG